MTATGTARGSPSGRTMSAMPQTAPAEKPGWADSLSAIVASTVIHA